MLSWPSLPQSQPFWPNSRGKNASGSWSKYTYSVSLKMGCSHAAFFASCISIHGYSYGPVRASKLWLLAGVLPRAPCFLWGSAAIQLVWTRQWHMGTEQGPRSLLGCSPGPVCALWLPDGSSSQGWAAPCQG